MPYLSTILFHFGLIATGLFPQQSNLQQGNNLPDNSTRMESELEIIFDYQEGLIKAGEVHKPICLLFTGRSCSNNQKLTGEMKREGEIRQTLSEEFINVWLYLDDKTNLSADEIAEKKMNGKNFIMRTTGQKWALLEIEKFHCNAQPLMTIIDESENILKAPETYPLLKEKLKEYLLSGLQEYK